MQFEKHKILALLLTSLLVTCVSGKSDSSDYEKNKKKTKQPNIIFVLLDDLGYADVGYLQTTSFTSDETKYFKTKNIDRLASEEGLILGRHYVHSLCTPTRAAFLTGTYPFRESNGLTTALSVFSDITLGSQGEYLFPYLLSNYGDYRTFMAGKWHVGRTQWSDTPITYFDKSVFALNGFIDYYEHSTCVQQISWPLSVSNACKIWAPILIYLFFCFFWRFAKLSNYKYRVYTGWVFE